MNGSLRTLAHVACALGLLAAVASSAAAQIRRPPTGGQSRRPPQESRGVRAPVDSTKKDTALVTWAESDSVMEALMARDGYAVTRYQGNTVTFDASDRSLSLIGRRAAVGRGDVLVVGDTIVYSDSLQIVTALGDTNTLRDPSQGEDIVARGRIRYDIRRQTGVVTNISTAVTEGERWILHGGVAAIARDTSAARRDAYYVKDGDITSCDDTIPHYHFRTTQMKVVAGSVIVARPAVLYIMDIPVMVLPFLFADISKGRHSGILTPRFGIAELLRNSPGYRRRVENFGYYWDINHFMDASAWVNWLSNARPSLGDQSNLFSTNAPGNFDYNGEFNYRWIDRFMQGSFAASLFASADGNKTESVFWNHSQDFSLTRHLRMNLNYTTNTSARQRTQFNPISQVATIQSGLSYQQQLGPLELSLGGTRTQYSGFKFVQQSYPSLSIVPRGSISIGKWLTWTPSLTGTVSEALKNDRDVSAGYFLRRSTTATGGIDSALVLPSNRQITASFNTPIRIRDFEIPNAFTLTDVVDRSPSTHVAFSGPSDTVGQVRRFGEFTRTDLDWQPGFSLPRIGQGKFNLTPSVSLANVGPGAFFVRSTTSGGRWVRQTKRPSFALSATPTVYGLFPGFGPVSRFRHSINPQISFGYSPAARVSNAYLQATGTGSSTSLLGIAENNVSLGLSTNIEAKLAAASDTSSNEAEARKIKIVSLNFTGVSYNFQQLKERRRRAQLLGSARPNAFVGLNTQTFGFSATSDLLPGFSFSNSYSLFTDNPAVVDTARFSPYREATSINFSVNRQTNFIAAIARVFGSGGRANDDRTAATRATTGGPGSTAPDTVLRRAGAIPVAGSYARDQQFNVPQGRGFQASFSFSSSRQRPIPGVRTITDAERCAQYPLTTTSPVVLSDCLSNPSAYPLQAGTESTIAGARATFRPQPNASLNSQMSFNITPKWAASWGTTYDVENKRFGGQIVNLQRELHDWRAVFGFTQSPNGAFAFTFFISLNAEPDLKFNYDRRSYPNSF